MLGKQVILKVEANHGLGRPWGNTIHVVEYLMPCEIIFENSKWHRMPRYEYCGLDSTGCYIDPFLNQHAAQYCEQSYHELWETFGDN